MNDRETAARALIADFAAGRFKAATKHFRWWMRWVVRAAHLTEMAEQLGALQRVLEVQSDDEGVVLPCDFERAAIDVRVFFDRRDRIVGLLFEPSTTRAAPAHFADYVTKTPLRLPFDGEWLVFWGGRTIEENHHASTADQRFAYDFLRDGCWDAPIYAPAAGVVTESVDGIDDHGTNVESPAGNHVVIDHENGEYSVLAHLRRGSVAVRTGGRVKTGTLLGRCGNSGHSSEPHLHYHLQNAPAFGRGEGLPAQFRDYVADGGRVAVGEPRKGQRLMANATSNSWQHLPAPAEREDLSFQAVFTAEEAARLMCGVIPRAMEDKWFIYYDDGWLCFHRSWTGAFIYGLRLETSAEGVRVAESWVNRNPNQYRGTNAEYDRQLVRFLIDAFLLDKPGVTFPVPAGTAGAPPGVVQHSYAGRAYPERTSGNRRDDSE